MESARAYLVGDFFAAGDILGRIGTRPDEAETRLQSAGQLIADDRAAEADAQLERALAFYRSVTATRAVRECEALRQRA